MDNELKIDFPKRVTTTYETDQVFEHISSSIKKYRWTPLEKRQSNPVATQILPRKEFAKISRQISCAAL